MCGDSAWMKERKKLSMAKKDFSQHNMGIQEITEGMLDQITGGTTKTYTVQSGDSLSAIAAKEYGSSDKWHRIYQKNKNVIGDDPNQIRPGQKLELAGLS
jgi:nucleoid-associated protein YgaU